MKFEEALAAARTGRRFRRKCWPERHMDEWTIVPTDTGDKLARLENGSFVQVDMGDLLHDEIMADDWELVTEPQLPERTTCATCTHWVAIQGGSDLGTGECHYGPPATITTERRHRWPWTEGDELCGQHSPKGPKE